MKIDNGCSTHKHEYEHGTQVEYPESPMTRNVGSNEPTVVLRSPRILPRIIAIVVTRNRPELLGNCLEVLARQTCSVAEVLVIDNASTDDTERVVREATCKPSYLRLDQNLGSSMGFYKGIQLGIEKGYDWFWLMDDDLIPELNCLEELTSSSHFLDDDAGFLAAVVMTPEGNLEERSRSRLLDIKSYRTLRVCDSPAEDGKVESINCAAFLGLLVSRRAVQRVGFPLKDLFISGDDVEYCFRIIKSGLKGYLVWGAITVHFSPRVQRLKKWFLPSYTCIPKDALWKVYCGYRNRAYLITQHCSRKALLREFIRLAGAILIYDDEKTRRLRLLCKGFQHGRKGRLCVQDVMAHFQA